MLQYYRDDWYVLEHSNSRFVLYKNRPFNSLVVMQLFLLIYCTASAEKQAVATVAIYCLSTLALNK